MNENHPVQAYRDMIELLEASGYLIESSAFHTDADEGPISQFSAELTVTREPSDNQSDLSE